MTQVLFAGAGLQPDEAVRVAVQRFHRFVSGGGVLPHRVGLAMEEKRAVAGVFGVEVDLPGQDRGAHDIGRAELHLALDRNAARFQRLRDHVAEQRALGVFLRGDDDRPGGRIGRAVQRNRCQRQTRRPPRDEAPPSSDGRPSPGAAELSLRAKRSNLVPSPGSCPRRDCFVAMLARNDRPCCNGSERDREQRVDLAAVEHDILAARTAIPPSPRTTRSI